MEIIKELNLNKNPKVAKNNSTIFARNIKLDETGTLILPDNLAKFELDFGTIQDLKYNQKNYFNNSTIINGISTGTELILFFDYEDVTDENEIHNRYLGILRYSDKGNYKILKTFIHYHNGDISSTYTYNNKSELILSFCEYDGNEDSFMKTVNFDDCYNKFIDRKEKETDIVEIGYDESYFNNNVNVPICQCKSEIIESKNIACGVYQFFIRYYISDLEFTKWFPIGKELYALNLTKIQYYNHRYSKSASTKVNYFTVNNPLDKATNSFVLNLEFNNVPAYLDKYQIGYIIRREDSIQGRIFLDGDIYKNRSIKFSDNYFLNQKVESVDNFISDVYNIYNVKNIINHKNRLYISNYKEYDIDKTETFYNNYVNNITIKINAEEIDSIDKTTAKNTYTLVECKIYDSLGDKRSLNFNLWYDTNDVKDDGSIIVNIGTNTNIIDVTGYVYIIRCQPISYNGSHVFMESYNHAYLDKCKIKLIKGDDEKYAVQFQFPDGSIAKHKDSVECDCLGGGGNTPFPIYNTQNEFHGFITSETSSITYIKQFTVLSDKRTLMPLTPYSFYIHFVREDGSYTDGYKLKLDSNAESYKIYKTNTNEYLVILFEDNTESYTISFNNINIPTGYKGYFISYEKPSYTINYFGIIRNVSNDRLQVEIKAKEVDLALSHYSGKGLIIFSNNSGFTIEEANYVPANTSISDSYNRLGEDGEIYITLTLPLKDGVKKGDICCVLNNGMYSLGGTPIRDEEIYGNKNKTLIRLTDVCYNTKCSDEYCDFNYSEFYTNEQQIIYKNKILIDSIGIPQVYKDGILTPYSYDSYAEKLEYNKFSQYNLAAISLKHKPTEKFVVPEKSEDKYYSKYYDVTDLSDYCELKSEYINKNNIKTYTNIDSVIDYLTVFDNTIRRSDVYSDESRINNWRNFRPLEYKMVNGNKGKIVKLVSFGTNILIHNEGSLSMFNIDNKLAALNKTVQLEAVDPFDFSPIELVNSDTTRCGIKKKNHAALFDIGYVFYSDVDKTIYCYSSKLQTLSTNIDKFIKSVVIDDINFGEDFLNKRFFVCIKTRKSFDIERKDYVTLSFNTLINNFVSVHNFAFSKAFAVNNNMLALDVHNTYLYNFGRTNGEYSYMDMTYADSYFPDVTPKAGSRIHNCIIDIIYNIEYEKIKTLESIEYILNEIISDYVSDNIADNISRPYSGYAIKVYSDSCETDIQDLRLGSDNSEGNFVQNSKVTIDSYKHPWCDRGVWHYNFFRNIKTDNTNAARTEAGAKILAQYVGTSDFKSLIFGKYIVVRFILPMNINFKLENLNIKVV